jgi:hypothetical protein
MEIGIVGAEGVYKHAKKTIVNLTFCDYDHILGLRNPSGGGIPLNNRL